MRRHMYLSAIVVGALLTASAQGLDTSLRLTQHSHRIWQISQGLPEPTIYKVIQSRNGYIWLATLSGLVRFDGVRFTAIRQVGDLALDHTTILDLAEDASGRLWLATDGAGLVSIAGDTAKRLDHRDGLPADRVERLAVAPDGTVWFTTPGGVGSCRDEKIVRLEQDGEAPVRAGAIFAAGDGAVYLGERADRVRVYRDGKLAPVKIESVPQDARVQAISQNADGLWIGTSAGLVLKRSQQEVRFTSQQGLADNNVTCLIPGRNGEMFIGTPNGFSRYDKGEISSFRARDGLSQSTVYTLCEDREGGLWVGTKHGLDQFYEGRTVSFTTSEGLTSNNIGPIVQTASGAVWVGTLDAGLNRYDGHSFTRVTAGIPSACIRALQEDAQGTLWVGTDHGLARIAADGAVQTLNINGQLPSRVIDCLAVGRDGTLWIGTASGLARYQNGNVTRVGPEMAIRALTKRSSGSIVAATDEGVFNVSGESWERLAQARAISSLFEDAEGLLWAGTRGDGLLLIEGGKISRMTTREGLFDDDIFGIASDSRDRLWMACSKGIFAVNRASLKQLSRGDIQRVTPLPITPTESMRTVECQPDVAPSICSISGGRLWFSTIRGVVMITAENLPRKLPAPQVVIENIIVNGTEQTPADIASIEPGKRNIEFRFTALSYIVPSRITFRYKLEGFDRDWVDADTRREATYTNLPPGHYRFSVRARNADGTWSESDANAAFVMRPEFYQQRGFIYACAVVAAAMIWLAYVVRVRFIRRDLELIAAERSRIARELHDTLIQGFSGVTMQLQALYVRLTHPAEQKTLQEIIQDAGECLREARHSVAGLRENAISGSGLIQELGNTARELTRGTALQLVLELQNLPRQIPGSVEHHLVRIAGEAIGNVLKHAQAQRVTVRLESDDAILRLTIEDDGRGFDPDADMPQGHFGIIGMRERAHAIGASLVVESDPGHGTIVSVALPLRAKSTKSKQVS